MPIRMKPAQIKKFFEALVDFSPDTSFSQAPMEAKPSSCIGETLLLPCQ